MKSVNITEEECIRNNITKNDTETTVDAIRWFANEFYNKKINKTLFDIKKEFPKDALKYNRNYK